MTDIPTRQGLACILIPDPSGQIQDLGPILSGILMETDILPGSAIIARCGADGQPLVSNGIIRAAFEGNRHNAVNLRTFHEKAAVAASRLASDYPSVAYARLRPDQVIIAGLYDLDRFFIREITHPSLLEDWTGLPAERILPAKTISGTWSEAEFARLHADPGRTLCCPPMVYRFTHLPGKPTPSGVGGIGGF